ncbi:serine hydrolase domain-containing protein [Falsiroseomonas oryzae]|uniref:serine hydrolase domain-containing protein n=1 Tax=Falsiroseomonas oryzae TaxID=2766473 RepID=UPI0022EACE06|nr:serine hydrolase domain-containing protein [Roseomonas sp. MO-31]
MVTRRLLLGLAAAGLLATPLAARMPESRVAALDAAVRQLVDGNSTPGVVVLILQDGQPVYQRAHGVREAGGSTPIAMTDMFRLASMTKVVTSTAALILVEEGKIGLDDPISRHLPEFANLRVRQADGTLVAATRPPTVRELMTHTSGLSYVFMNAPGVVDAYRQAGVTDGLATDLPSEEAARRLAAAPLKTQPGTEFHYSLSTDVLGWVVERVSGRPLGSFVAERIARPLGLESFMFRAPAALAERFVPVTRTAEPRLALGLGVVPVRAAEPVAFPATGGQALLDPSRPFNATGYHSGGGGMSGNIADYARFLTAMARGGELDGVRILRPETVRLITENATGNLATLRGPGWGHSLGAGVLVDPAAARTRLPAGSWGWGGIYGTQFWVDPVNRIVGVVKTQTAVIGSGPVANLVREAAYPE